ncbi:hypothetical protein KKD19_00430 [Patescibacteria group bacterium]|nr:hypothetical protein [Patescibacteria group bacterium]MCG2688762.1 hypothetical protein [Candidatus Parcubacteria bacterium]
MNEKYLITYELKTPNWNYTGFYNALKNLGEWWHYLDSTWVIKNTSYDSIQMYDILRKHISVNDFILIVEIKPETKWGYLPGDAWGWLDS